MGKSSTYIEPSISLSKSCNLQYQNQCPVAKKTGYGNTRSIQTELQFQFSQQKFYFKHQFYWYLYKYQNFLSSTSTFWKEQGKKTGLDNRGQRRGLYEGITH